jgi:hypothetical protein
MRTAVLALICLFVLGGAAFGAKTIYFDRSAAAGGDGVSWATAYNDWAVVYQATSTSLVTEMPVRVFVKKGTYPSGQLTNFVLSDPHFNGLELYGGFAGTETTASQRTDLWGANATILKANSTSFRPMTLGNAASGTMQFKDIRLDGFVLTGGQSTTSGSGGGGLFISNCEESVVVANCQITSNSDLASHASGKGGGVVVQVVGTGRCAPTFVDCEISKNFSGRVNDAAGGGGFYFGVGTTGTLLRCNITNNMTLSTRGGGLEILSRNTAGPRLTDCLVSNNTVGLGNGSDPGLVKGAGIFVDGNLTLESCRIIGNTAFNTTNFNEGGGAIFVDSAGATTSTVVVDRCTLSGNRLAGWPARGGAINVAKGNLTVTNSVVSGNYVDIADSWGSAIYLDAGTMSVTNCTFDGNRGIELTRGVIATKVKNVPISNSIFSTNSTTDSLVLSAGPSGTGTYVQTSNLNFNNGGTVGNDPLYVTTGANGVSGTWAAIVSVTTDTLTSRGTSVLRANGTPFANKNLAGKLLEPRTQTYRHVLILSNTDDTVTVAGNMTNFAEGFRVFVGSDFHVAEYQLQGPASPAYDTASVALATAVDILGVSRPKGAGPDIGAYEWTVPPTKASHWTMY